MPKLKDIFICVAGATPQVITETLYALAEKTPPVYPEELFIITTLTGRKIIENDLITKGIFSNFMTEYNFPNLSIKEDSFVLVKGKDGRPLKDIRDDKDNEAVGDLITEFIRDMTEDPATRLHCSIAGGRKTMSFYLGSALQLFGRHWDRLYHILVSSEFESNRDFYYPPRKPVDVACRMPDGSTKKLNTANAGIELAELPLIKLRERISLNGKNFREMIEEGQSDIDVAIMQPTLRIKIKDRALKIGEYNIDLVPMQVAIYLLFADQKLSRCLHPERPYCYDCADCFLTIQQFMGMEGLKSFVTWYDRMFGKGSMKGIDLYERHRKEGGISPENIRQIISKLKTSIKEQIEDSTLLPLYTVATVGKHGYRRYGIRAEKSKIIVE